MLEQLERRARETGQSLTALVERYILEGLRIDQHPDIVFRDGPAGRRAGIAGGLDVWEVVGTVQDNAGSLSAAAEYLAVPQRHINAAMNYYVDYPDEIDTWIEENDRLYEQAELRICRVAEAFG